mgnify:CR=1 FL=1
MGMLIDLHANLKVLLKYLGDVVFLNLTLGRSKNELASK